jgi:hypothetical protein
MLTHPTCAGRSLLAQYAYLKFYVPLSASGLLKLERQASGKAVLCWRRPCSFENFQNGMQVLSLPMVEVSSDYFNDLNQFAALRRCTFQNRPGCLFGLAILVRNSQRIFVSIFGH